MTKVMVTNEDGEPLGFEYIYDDAPEPPDPYDDDGRDCYGGLDDVPGCPNCGSEEVEYYTGPGMGPGTLTSADCKDCDWSVVTETVAYDADGDIG